MTSTEQSNINYSRFNKRMPSEDDYSPDSAHADYRPENPDMSYVSPYVSPRYISGEAGDAAAGDALFSPFMASKRASWSPSLGVPPASYQDRRTSMACLDFSRMNIQAHAGQGGISKPMVNSAVESRVTSLLDPPVFARKVFVGGLPFDIDSDTVRSVFSQFGSVYVDWPSSKNARGLWGMTLFTTYKIIILFVGIATILRIERGAEVSARRTGYVFLVYENETSVQKLVQTCHNSEGLLYFFISSNTMKRKPVQIFLKVRPWRLADTDYVPDASRIVDPRKTIFIGGVPRPTRAVEIATVLQKLYGEVIYAGVDIDPELKYPKGAARVTFAAYKSYMLALRGKTIKLPHGENTKLIEMRPYIMDDQECDECGGKQRGARSTTQFCANHACLQYYCDVCWEDMHWSKGLPDFHKHEVLLRQGDLPRAGPRPSQLHQVSGSMSGGTAGGGTGSTRHARHRAYRLDYL